MALKETLSGFRGTFGGEPGTNLTPIEITAYAAAFASYLKTLHERPSVLIGRDGRISGPIVSQIASGVLQASGIDVIDLDLTTTPTIEMAVLHYKAQGAIIFTASHNPKEWNAFKMLDDQGEFLGPEAVSMILTLKAEQGYHFPTVDNLGSYTQAGNFCQEHVQAVLDHPLVQVDAIRTKNYTVVLDSINSTGSLLLRPLLEALNCTYHIINEDITGDFAHVAEPLPQHLDGLAQKILAEKADIGIAVDPDADRLVLADEKGQFPGEEYTIVIAADYVLSQRPGNVVTNMSSTSVLDKVAEKYGYHRIESAVGEANVVSKMKEVNAVIGGEGNGGVIMPDLHYGRDSAIGVALVLSYMASTGMSMSEIRAQYPNSEILKHKIKLNKDSAEIIQGLDAQYKNYQKNLDDGIKIQFDDCWVHVRASNTEPIMRIIAESHSKVIAENLIDKLQQDIGVIMRTLS